MRNRRQLRRQNQRIIITNTHNVTGHSNLNNTAGTAETSSSTTTTTPPRIQVEQDEFEELVRKMRLLVERFGADSCQFCLKIAGSDMDLRNAPKGFWSLALEQAGKKNAVEWTYELVHKYWLPWFIQEGGDAVYVHEEEEPILRQLKIEARSNKRSSSEVAEVGGEDGKNDEQTEEVGPAVTLPNNNDQAPVPLSDSAQKRLLALPVGGGGGIAENHNPQQFKNKNYNYMRHLLFNG